MTMMKALRQLGVGATVHGMRSTFRDRAWEQTGTPREIAKLCLPHQVGNAMERAYARSDLLDRRRELMERWGRFCTGDAGRIVELCA